MLIKICAWSRHPGDSRVLREFDSDTFPVPNVGDILVLADGSYHVAARSYYLKNDNDQMQILVKRIAD